MQIVIEISRSWWNYQNMPKYKWLKFRVTEDEYKEIKKTFIDSGARYFWQWCRKKFVASVKKETDKPWKHQSNYQNLSRVHFAQEQQHFWSPNTDIGTLGAWHAGMERSCFWFIQKEGLLLKVPSSGRQLFGIKGYDFMSKIKKIRRRYWQRQIIKKYPDITFIFHPKALKLYQIKWHE